MKVNQILQCIESADSKGDKKVLVKVEDLCALYEEVHTLRYQLSRAEAKVLEEKARANNYLAQGLTKEYAELGAYVDRRG
jgi:hypothetical protein